MNTHIFNSVYCINIELTRFEKKVEYPSQEFILNVLESNIITLRIVKHIS